MQPVIEQIKHRLPITDVLSSYITLVPSGTQFKAKCPFHNERTASFSVSPDRGVYYCFGCGAKGDIFNFVQEFEGVDFMGALKILAERAGVSLKNVTHTEGDRIKQLYEILEEVTDLYQKKLLDNSAALSYLEKRGVKKETIAQFRIGYAPMEWRTVALKYEGAKTTLAERAGLIKKTEKGYYDRFRGRIQFPLSDSTGRIVGFSGRIFPETPEGPKYLNSPETELFQKSKILFGFDKAKFAIKKHGFAILVEGQMDVVLSHQAGFKNTVATSGTAVSDVSIEDKTTNLRVLSRITPHIFLAFDGDNAGQKALRRAAYVALRLGMNPKVVPLPEGFDPADYILSHGTEAWKELLKESKHFIVHELHQITKDQPSPHVLVRMLRERIFPYLSAIPSPIERNLYLETIAREIGISVKEVSLELENFKKESGVPGEVKEIIEDKKNISAIERFLGLHEVYKTEKITQYHNTLAALSYEEQTFSFPEIPDTKMQIINHVIESEYGHLEVEQKEEIARELVNKIIQQFYKNVSDMYTKKLKTAEREDNEEESMRITKILNDLHKLKHG